MRGGDGFESSRGCAGVPCCQLSVQDDQPTSRCSAGRRFPQMICCELERLRPQPTAPMKCAMMRPVEGARQLTIEEIRVVMSSNKQGQ